ncbi:DUF4142 domain-containing protein [Aquiflexum sp. LQ15W]|uniref:DUF4142 domain-containing protein n=1 Tax=Cognataquiflexum nitidum TaxID=2922272 RepID=UPI001F147474|nr:DUF4142 domain-containing protein [Cognataquiflexum nitidum]MCH6201869.1 DUF4142 domain-containing protein [Cognataquiflexum nitidum]
MKTQINIKSILLHTICVAGTMFFASSCSENKTTDSMEVAEEENISRLTNDDETIVVIDNDNGVKFLMAAAEIQLEEISLGKLAQEKGTTPHVKELGKMMEVSHTKTLAELNNCNYSGCNLAI